MATEVAAPSKWQSVVSFVRDSFHEVRHKSTWPELAQVRQASIAIIIFVLFVGLIITLLDTIFGGLFTNLIPSLFS